jgi:hypothetical protein
MGCLMARDKYLISVLILLAPPLFAACSGLPKSGSPPPPSGTATVALTMSAKPLTPPPGTSLLSFSMNVNSIALSPASGTAFSFPLNTGSSTFAVDLTRLQSDSAFLGLSKAVPVGSYTSITIGLGNPTLTYCKVAVGTPGCTPGSVTTIHPGVAAPVITTSLTLIANQPTGLALNLDLNKAITVDVTTQVPTVDLTATNVLSVVPLPRPASFATGQLDFVEDITGTVTSASGETVTVATATHGSYTATGSTAGTVFSPACANGTIACVQIGQVASIDTAINADGTLSLLEYDPIDTSTTGHDWIEGVIAATPTSSSQFQLVANEEVLATASSLIRNNLGLGEPVQVTLGAGRIFSVDVKGLTVPVPQAVGFAGATDTSLLLPGQTVAVRVTSFTAGSGALLAQASADLVDLRYSRVPGNVLSLAAPTTLTLQNLPSFFGLTINPLVQLSSGTPPNFAATNYDGVSSASGITAGASQTYTIRALYFGPVAATPFSTAKVRAN